MPAIRLRHPNGVSTLQVAFDHDGFTVLDLQQEIYTATDILPSRQIRTYSMYSIPELPKINI